MTIEIPEIGLYRECDFTGGWHSLEALSGLELSVNPSYNGKFVVMGNDVMNSIIGLESINPNTHLYNDIPHAHIANMFHSMHDNWKYHATGGGHVKIEDGRIILSGTGDFCGKYDMQIVRPIIERFVSMTPRLERVVVE
ncbi:hypothetical protein CMI45_02045 [Candidatus Pacearchaeota archaeon]|nr:hypothetical protein [Candidatus Pacearchaeota archaeon]|tara:strand:- start:1084 stop:1500 length:417 start_codon:yes stop_codon:yes gene_type:complete